MNKPLLVLTLTTLGSGAAAVWMYSQLSAERVRSDELQARIAALGNEHTAASRVRQHAPEADTLPASSLTHTLANTTTPTAALTQSTPPEQRERWRPQERQQDPDFQRAVRFSPRSLVQRMYPDMVRELGISQEQADRLLDLLAKQQERTQQSLREFNGTEGEARAEMAQRLQERRQTERAEIAELLGNENLAKWESYQQDTPARPSARNLRNALADTDSPLREDQLQSLQDAFAQSDRDARLQRQQTQPSFASDRMTPNQQQQSWEWQREALAQNHERQRQAAASILTSEQMRELARLQEEQEAMQSSLTRMQRAQLERRESREDSRANPGQRPPGT